MPKGLLLTWTTYGTWLHGDDRYSVDADHNIPGTPFASPSTKRRAYHAANLKCPPVLLNEAARRIMTQAVHDHCAIRDWLLHTVNVRSNHVHVVLTCDVTPDLAIEQFKSWGTRRLRAAGLFRPETRIWTAKGSKHYLWTHESLRRAILYVAEGQGGLPLPIEPPS